MVGPDGEQSAAKLGFIEQARNKDLARDLADFQTRITQRLIRLHTRNPQRFERIGGEVYKGELTFFTLARVQGVRNVGLGITHALRKNNVYKKKVGVDTPTMVSLGIHTNRETWEQIRQDEAYDWESRFGLTASEVKEIAVGEGILTEDEFDDATFPGPASDEYGTDYFVDSDGNFAKVISLPESMAEGREDLQIYGHQIDGVVSVQVPMMARDFVLMKTTLETMRKKIR